MTTFSAVVLEEVIRVTLTKNDVFQKSVLVISLHWSAKIGVTVTTVKIRLEYTRLQQKSVNLKEGKELKQSSQVQRSISRKYIFEKGENVVATGWTNTELFIFDSCCDFLTKKKC